MHICLTYLATCIFYKALLLLPPPAGRMCRVHRLHPPRLVRQRQKVLGTMTPWQDSWNKLPKPCWKATKVSTRDPDAQAREPIPKHQHPALATWKRTRSDFRRNSCVFLAYLLSFLKSSLGAGFGSQADVSISLLYMNIANGRQLGLLNQAGPVGVLLPRATHGCQQAMQQAQRALHGFLPKSLLLRLHQWTHSRVMHGTYSMLQLGKL